MLDAGNHSWLAHSNLIHNATTAVHPAGDPESQGLASCPEQYMHDMLLNTQGPNKHSPDIYTQPFAARVQA